MEPVAIENTDPQIQVRKPIGSPVLRALATFISYVFHPIFMPVLLSVVIWRIQPAEFAGMSNKLLLFRLASMVMTTIFFPLLTIALAKALGFVQSIHMRVAKDRIIPLISTMIFYFWVQRVFSNVPDTPKIINILLLGSFWGIILLFMASIWFKVSMHTTAAGGAIGIMVVLLFLSPFNMLPALFTAIFIGGLVGTARLLLREHTPFELWVGYLIGLVVQLGAWAYLS